MNEINIINNYLKPLTAKNSGALNLTDDIYFNKKNKTAISIDTYVKSVHFINSNKPKYFLRKVLRSSLSDLYCKGIKPHAYFLSFALNKKIAKNIWLKNVQKILRSEQKKFKIKLGGGDTTYSSKFVITIAVLGYCKNKPVLRKGALINDDIYVTGNIADSFIGLSIIKKKINLGFDNPYFKKKFFEPNLSNKITPYLYKIASSSIDISDGLAQDLHHICKNSNCGANINLNFLPLSKQCKKAIKKKKISLKNIFSKGDDYQILFTSNKKNRLIIKKLSKKLNLKISRIGEVTKKKNILFEYNNTKFNLDATKMGYKHTF